MSDSERWNPGPSAASLLRFGLLVALQLAVVFALDASRTGRTSLIGALGLAALAGLAAGLLFLLPRQALLITPILIVIPAALLYIRAFEWIFMAALAAYLLRYGSMSVHRVRVRSVDVVFLLYILWGFVSLKGAVRMPAALLGMKTVILFFLAFQVGSRILGRRARPALFQVFALTAVAVAVQEFWVVASHGYSPALLATRISSLTDVGWGVSVYVSAVSVLAASASLPAVFHGVGRERILPILAVGAGVFTSLVALARGSLLALTSGILVCSLFLSRKRRVLALLLIGAMAAVYLGSPIGRASLNRFDSPQGLPSVGIRVLIYHEAVRIALAHPVFGVGPSQMPFHTYFFTGENPHNIFLKNAVDFGLVGLVLYLLLLGWVVRRGIHLRRHAVGRTAKARSLGIFAILCTALINASVEPTLGGPQYGFLFWLLVGNLTAPDEAQEVPPAVSLTESR